MSRDKLQGAADDLGGTSNSLGRCSTARIRFNGAADDLGGTTQDAVLSHRPDCASMGAPTISAEQHQYRPVFCLHKHVASMGPPTISAEQRTVSCDDITSKWVLQWGRRRSRRNNGIVCGTSWGMIQLQWGRRRSRRNNSRNEIARFICLWGFNGAADDLGGTTTRAMSRRGLRKWLQWGRRRSRRNNLAGHIRASSGLSLQWGRRRSRRNNATLLSPRQARLPGAKTRTSPESPVFARFPCPHHTASSPKSPDLARLLRKTRTPRAFAIDPGSRNAPFMNLVSSPPSLTMPPWCCTRPHPHRAHPRQFPCSKASMPCSRLLSRQRAV
ncbi:hypothetical protein TC41_2959 [Alicyclobacillus acidocaldarius subsp. acidocaldarius Tc-4-1]|uniref:Uncharacterized protein n=1 Tax=Alicyclobacillus acidocaldarius (strain Tc-4-1) TaxID=1048834 RepID=F8IKT2_ALIAT|nr:hypothetical protein TC41_2959 [Alicyclobacillus acidocaldarius subsp. acidocaldarius Tc-4-1]